MRNVTCLPYVAFEISFPKTLNKKIIPNCLCEQWGDLVLAIKKASAAIFMAQ